ncbi:MAG TPA: hypothetical protein DEB43_04300 [Desulfovibrio sp.]|nr:hypothetical protein [Desulfovibrio sp.]
MYFLFLRNEIFMRNFFMLFLYDKADSGACKKAAVLRMCKFCCACGRLLSALFIFENRKN